MRSRYTGKEPCHGCGRPGSELPRVFKDSLCDDCRRLIVAGKAAQREQGMKYQQVRDWHHGLAKLDFDDRSLDTLATAMFEAMHNQYAEGAYRRGDELRPNHGGSAVFRIIPEGIIGPLKAFFDALDAVVSDIRVKKERAEAHARNAVVNERTRIYNEGIRAGRDLLVQLAAGEITLKDLDTKTFTYDGHSKT